MTCYVQSVNIPSGIISDKSEEYKLTCEREEDILNFYESINPKSLLFQINTKTHTLKSPKCTVQCLVRNMGQYYQVNCRAFPDFTLELKTN